MRSRWSNWLATIGLASVVLVMCRDFPTERASHSHGTSGSSSHGGSATSGAAGDNGGESGAGTDNGGTGAVAGESGTGSAEGGTGAAAGASGTASGRGGTSAGGSSGANGGGGGGEPAAGESGSGATGGEAGSGGNGDDPEAEPGIYGAVRLMIDGVPKCGGTLITNSWLLTANDCIPSSEEFFASMVVGFGMDTRHFEQVRRAREVIRLPASVTDVHDVALLGVDAPFVVNGSTAGHFIPLFFDGANLRGEQLCVGWDLMPASDSPTNLLHSETLVTVDVGEPPDEEMIWWMNSNPGDLEHGALMTQNDLGSGCFRHIHSTAYLTSVSLGVPSQRHDGVPNNNEEAYSMSVAQASMNAWLDNALFEEHEPPPFSAAGDVALCSRSSARLEVFTLDDAGNMRWFEQVGWPGRPEGDIWDDMGTIAPPSGGTPLAPDRPAVICTTSGNIELFARAVDDTVWWQRFRDGAWASDWSLVPVAFATSGLSAAQEGPERFHLMYRGRNTELRHDEYVGSLPVPWSTTDLAGLLDSAPILLWHHPEWSDTFVRAGTRLWDHWHSFGDEGWWNIADATTDPAGVTFDEDDYIFTKNSQGNLIWQGFSAKGYPPLVETNLPVPDARPTAVMRARGMFEIFATKTDGSVWHVSWPRRPASP